MQIASLPELPQQRILQQVEALGAPHFGNLRSCSRSWRLLCDDNRMSVSVDVDNLALAMPFLTRLPSLQHITIKAERNRMVGGRYKDQQQAAGILRADALVGLGARGIKVLELVSGGYDYVQENEGEDCFLGMQIESLVSMLSPWVHSLQRLHMKNCELSCIDWKALSMPGFLSTFPHLAVLQINEMTTMHVRYPRPPHEAGGGLHDFHAYTSSEFVPLKLDLGGCTSLRVLECCESRLDVLDVRACSALESLDCSRNCIEWLDVSGCATLRTLSCDMNNLSKLEVAGCEQLQLVSCSDNDLTCLDFSSCANLKELDCYGSELEKLSFSPEAQLETLSCAQNGLPMVESPAATQTVTRLTCNANLLGVLYLPDNYAQLIELALEGGSVGGELAGFKNLQYLSCSMAVGGSLDLTGCTEPVELVLNRCRDGAPVLGRSMVWKLHIKGRFALSNMAGFTNLRELRCCADLRGMEVLDLSICKALRAVRVVNANMDGEGRQQTPTSLAKIDLTGCSSLEELVLGGFAAMRELDLSPCSGLASLICIWTGIKSLDVSCCPGLAMLDVKHSHFLERLVTGRHDVMKDVSLEDCPMLRRGVERNV